MKIGMCMLLWTTQVDSSHLPLLEDIKKTGFDGVEIPIFDGTPDDYAALGVTLDKLGLERTAINAMGDPAHNLISEDASVRAAGVDYMKWLIDCTQALGADTVSGPIHSTLGHFTGRGPTAAERSWSVESQNLIGEHAATRDVTVCLEALNRFECYLVNTMDDLCAHLKEINHPNIRAMYDTFHANIEEADPVMAYVNHVPDIGHIHISENDRGVPGRGHIDWPAIFAAIASSDYPE